MPENNTQPRTYAAAHFALELDGKQDVGLFRSIEGGGMKVDVMTYQNGSNYDRWRQLGKQKYEDFKVQVGMAMSKPFYDWIEHFFEGNAERKNGAIVAADFYYKERARREFKEAMIKELTFPKLDAADKNAAYMSIAVAVEDIVFKPGGGKKLTQPKGMEGQKLWTSCNFRFVLDGFEQACKRITKVDSFTIKQNVIEYHSGGRQSPTKTPSQIEFPQLSFYVPEADAQPFMDHFNDYALKTERSQRGHSAKRSGMIQTYDNSRRPLFTLEFFEAEIIAITPDKSDAGSEDIKQVKIDLFTEKMAFSYAAMDVL
ncbi:MAG: phage tail protein [Myxococcales bacterium]|nr:phage tail protein [Myxococcales bacterium]